MKGGLRIAALALALTAGGCGVESNWAPIPPEELTRLETDGDCRAATPGNRLPYFRCRGDYDSWD